MRHAYPLTEVPSWCGMLPEDHQCLGGCLGILYGKVQAEGEAYCEKCELYSPENKAQREVVLANLSQQTPMITHLIKTKEFVEDDRILSVCGGHEEGYIAACGDIRRVNCPKCLEIYNDSDS